MGKKSKIGKQRRDKFYHLAKETGYRSRSAFKLIQLNRKFEFLQKSRVVVDLCAAPGGWLQVASKNMPVSSVIVGVDLFPIRPIPRVTTFAADITTDKCRQELKKHLQGWDADCFLHDGAPNVGTNWLLDAHTQARLTLQALKLACELLKKGGWFVTKVFRSRDYQALIWVFHQLFKKVHATKPQASRTESAEIFVVCQSFIAPDKIDQKFFDPTHIFKELPVDTSKNKLEIFQDPAKKKKPKALGYDDGDFTLYHKVNISDFLNSDDPITLLNTASELVFDVEEIANHRLTTEEIRECAKDIKVLGRREIRIILTWHKNMKKVLEAADKWQKEQIAEPDPGEKRVEDPKTKGEGEDSDVNDDEDEEITKELEQMEEEERIAARRKKKDAVKKRRKLRERLHKVKVVQDIIDDSQGQSDSLFDLNRIKNRQQLSEVGKGDTKQADQMVEEEQEETDDEDQPKSKKIKFVKQTLIDPAHPEEGEEDDENSDLDEYPSDLDEDEVEILKEQDKNTSLKSKGIVLDEESDESDLDSGVEEAESNPLVVDLDDADTNTRLARKTSFWFSKDAFEGLEVDEDEDFEISQMVQNYQGRGGIVLEKPSRDETNDKDSKVTPQKSSRRVKFNTAISSINEEGIKMDDDVLSSDEEEEENKNMKSAPHQNGKGDDGDDDGDSSDDSDYDENMLMVSEQKEVLQPKNKSSAKKDGFEIVSSEPAIKKVNLDPEALALGTMIATSKKKRREIIEHGYHRYTYGDEDVLPDWFAADEKEHCKPNLPVTKEMVAEYKARLKEVNARPIKKIAEAKARKKFRLAKKLEKIRKRAEAISDTVEVSEKEKMNQIKSLYKKAGVMGKQKKEVTYIVAKKGMAGKRIRRPKSIKGPYKVVDARMKADMRGLKSKQQKKKKRKR